MLCIENVVGIDGHGSGTPKVQIYHIHKVKLPKLAFLPSYIKTYPFWKIFLTVNELGRFILLYAFLNELKKQQQDEYMKKTVCLRICIFNLQKTNVIISNN